MANLVGQQFVNLSAQLTPPTWREQEVTAICTLLHRPHLPLVTLTKGEPDD